ncbi:uncharacterized protein [Rutidosis leptorrhynchoides]|uniref:uncharacterized protein n=1 Tax=Rutidosis leptorrhynchoides TaxID=125765 RepID=UPI003A99BAE4
MKLRSSRVLERWIPIIDLGPENQDCLNERRLTLRSDKSHFGKKGAEIGVCDDNRARNLEMGMKKIPNSNDERLLLGSEVSGPIKNSVVLGLKPEIEEVEEESVERDSVVICLMAEIEEENVERVPAEEGNKSVSKNSIETRPVINDEVISPNVDCENGFDNIEADTFADDTIIVINPENGDVLGKRKRKRDSVSSVNGDNECTVTPLKLNKPRKRKNVEGLEGKRNVRVKMEEVDKDEVRVRARVLRSRSMIPVNCDDMAVDPVSGDDMAVDGGLSRTLKRCARPRKVWSEMEDKNLRPKKKLERRGRPRKVPVEVTQNKDGILTRQLKKKIERRGRPRKVPVEVAEYKDGILTQQPKKKLERRGRPRKVPFEVTECKDGILTQQPKKKLERRGRPRKLVPHEIHVGPKRPRGRPRKVLMNEVVLKGDQMKRLKKTMFKKRNRYGNVPKVEARTLAKHVTRTRTMKRKAVKKGPTYLKVVKHEENGVVEYLERGKYKQLIRDKISDMLLKSGWVIDLRQRQEKQYKDSVYIEPSGKRSHYSITRAYAMLKKKIEKGEADNNEIAAYSPIPEEEISMLFRYVDKERGYKKKKKKHKKTKLGKQNKSGSRRKRGDKVTNSRKVRPLARGSGLKDNKDAFFVTKKKRTLLTWMIDSGVILVGCKVQYGKTRRQKNSFEGTVTEDGVRCGCCNEVMGISEFVGHCGGKTSWCYDDLFLESGLCLSNCLVDSWKKEEELNIVKFNVIDVKDDDDSNDDTCNICGDGGNLICCDSCPSTFHQSCLGIENFPSGDWNCIYCSCKFCGVVSLTTSQVDGSHDTITSEMLSCYSCEEKFHQLCVQEVEVVNVNSDRLTFCGRKCHEIYERLQTYLGVKHELEGGFSWTLLQRSDVGQDFTVRSNQLKVEHNSKLAVAFSVMDECFVPIIDGRSGTNVIRNVVYSCGSNFKRLDYAGFLTAVLEKGDELITAATIRIHGSRLAEMPFIGTRHMYRRQGMCRRLLDAIESTLSSVGVEDLIIPAIPELLQTWTKVFGFMFLDDLKKQAMKSMSMMVFPGIDMLTKPLVQNQSADINSIPSAGLISVTSDDVIAEDTIEPNNESFEKDATEQIEESNFGEDTIKDELTEEPNVIVTDQKNDNSIDCHADISLCDLNYPVNLVPCDTDGGQSSVDFESLTDPETCVNHRLPALKLDVEIDGVKVKPSELTSELLPKNTFDLNLQPSVVETDMHDVNGDDSQVCLKAFEVCESRLHVDHIVASQTDSKPCESQPLVML